MLRRSPVFTAVAALTLALGIGADTAVFSVVNAVILRPLRFPHSERLMVILNRAASGERASSAFPPPEYLFVEWRDRATASFDAVAGAWSTRKVLSGTGETRFVRVGLASHDFLPMIGAQPFLGRGFTREEDQAGRDSVVVLDAGFWQRQFGGSREVLGRTLVMDDRPYTVIGIIPAGVRFANFGALDMWVPLAARPSLNAAGRGAMLAVGRLRPGVTPAAAQSEMDSVSRQLASERRAYRVPGAEVRPLQTWIVGDMRRTILMLLGAVGFVLLICCANIANLTLARSTARQKEMWIRSALGAGRWRLARQALVESVLLACIGGAAGLVLAFVAVRAIPAIRAIYIPRLEEVAVDRTVLAAAAIATLVCGILFGLAPALKISRPEEARPRLRNVLAATQMALALVLLSGAGLMGNSLLRLLNLDLGFGRSRVISVTPSVPRTG